MNIEENNIGDAIRLVGSRLRHFHTGENNMKEMCALLSAIARKFVNQAQ